MRREGEAIAQGLSSTWESDSFISLGLNIWLGAEWEVHLMV